MPETKNPFFKIEDLQNLEIHIVGLNSTSQVKFQKDAIKLTQILEQGMWLDLPARTCAMGHSLSLDINVKKLSGDSDELLESHIHVTGVIEEFEDVSKTRQLVRIQFRKYTMDEWKILLNFLKGKQKSINAMIRGTRK